MLTVIITFSAGFAAGLGIWWLSLDRRRGKEARELVQTHHLHVATVHHAYVRALRYGSAEDFTFLVRKAHPHTDGQKVSVLQPAGRLGANNHPCVIEGDHNVH